MHVPKVESWSESHEHTNVKREIMVTQSFCWQEMLKQEEKKKKKHSRREEREIYQSQINVISSNICNQEVINT